MKVKIEFDTDVFWAKLAVAARRARNVTSIMQSILTTVQVVQTAGGAAKRVHAWANK